MQTLILKKLENTLYRYLSLNPESQKLLAPLQNRIIGIHLQRPKFTIFFSFVSPHKAENIHVKLSKIRPDTVNTEIFTTLFQLMRLKLNPSPSLVNNQFHIQGDVETAQLFNELFRQHHIDWEEHLSKIIGDVSAYRMGQLFKKTTTLIKKNKKKLSDDCSEYLQEEARLLPASNEVKHFRQEIDRLRLQIDRLQAKIDRLNKKIC